MDGAAAEATAPLRLRPGAKLALVTGGGSGIGRALAVELAAQGMDVIITGRRLEALQQTAAQAPAEGRILPCAADVSTPEGRASSAACLPEGAALDVLVHNAACFQAAPLATCDLASFRATQQTNVEGPLFLTQELLPSLRRATNPRVLFVNSGVKDMAVASLGCYAASKAALFMLAQVLQVELAPEGIDVASCLPGLVESEITSLHMKNDDFSLKEVIAGRVEQGDYHTADEVARWMGLLLKSGPDAVVDRELFCKRLHDIDDPGHCLGLELRHTTEGSLKVASGDA